MESFSANFRVANSGYSCSGSFVNGPFYTIINRSVPLLPLEVSLALDPSGAGRIVGQISGYTWTADVVAERAAYSSANPAPQAGRKFTLRIPGGTNSLVEAGGDGFATLSISAAGAVSVVGTLGDGATFSQSASLSAMDHWPFYASLYSSRGLVLGWLSFTNQLGNQPGGPLFWSRPVRPHTQFYPSGFTLQPEAAGSLYSAASGTSILGLAGGHIIIEGGGLTRTITNSFSVNGSEFLPAAGANRVNLSVTASSGLFQGSFFDSDSLKTVSFFGALYQSQTNGAGYFQNADQTGRVLITP